MALEGKICSRKEDYSQWYLDVIKAADLADYAPVKGCMVIKPAGYAIWENIQNVLNKKFKETGVKNAYFPLLIPESFLKKEAEHVEGFAPECAVVCEAGGKKLEEPYVIRPTSETVIYDMFAKWISSYRDLPLLVNQWANIVRWEMRTRLFLRTSEFLWQEGHTAHATEDEAKQRALQMNKVYEDFAKEYLALPVIAGEKTESERFAGASNTYCIEAMMQDGKALQAGTSHLLLESFTSSFGVKFLDKDGSEKNVRASSWGVSTRLIGGLIMAHSDDKGLILPPKIAPIQVKIIEIGKEGGNTEKIRAYANKIKEELEKNYISCEIDTRDLRPGPKFFEWEQSGIPLRLDLGEEELNTNRAVLVRRDSGEKTTIDESQIINMCKLKLDEIQNAMYNKAEKFLKDRSKYVETYEELKSQIEGGFAWAYWCGDKNCEQQVSEQTKATIRCIPNENNEDKGNCVYCNKENCKKVVFARSY